MWFLSSSNLDNKYFNQDQIHQTDNRWNANIDKHGSAERYHDPLQRKLNFQRQIKQHIPTKTITTTNKGSTMDQKTKRCRDNTTSITEA